MNDVAYNLQRHPIEKNDSNVQCDRLWVVIPSHRRYCMKHEDVPDLIIIDTQHTDCCYDEI